MKASWRKPFGIFSILLLITVWAVLIASLSGFVGKWNIAFQSIFYMIAGIIWILPLKPLLLWMETGSFKILSDAGPGPQDDI
jgi:hypothetical protein